MDTLPSNTPQNKPPRKRKNNQRVTLQCEHCHKTYSVRESHAIRSEKHYCSMECYREVTKGVTKQCVICGNSFYVKRSVAEKTVCCSVSCAHRQGATTRTGKQNTDGFINCLHCGTLIEVVLPQPKGYERKFCSKKCDIAYKVGENNPTYKGNFIDCTCLFCGEAFKNPEAWVKRGRGKFCSRSCRSTYTIRKQGGMVSSIELIVKEELEKIPETYRHQHRIDKFLVDFFLPERNLVIECDGSYWHSLEKNRKNDLKKNEYMAKAKINLVRLTETDIRTKCQEIIQDALDRYPLIIQ